MKAYAVIGANWGDEGKGKIVDWLCSQNKRGVVVRFNGGAQAGHTVAADGIRHVFHHLGSGTLAGWPTFLAEDFICNPLLFQTELESVAATDILVDERCVVTTPVDMLLNRAVETARGSSRHGSCGVGINETVERSLRPRYRLTVADLLDEAKVRATVDLIQAEWLPVRLHALGLREGDVSYTVLGWSTRAFLEQATAFTERVNIMKAGFMPMEGPVIFEGAQGLALDENSPDFPYVTRSSTGLRNVAKLCKAAGITELEAVYVTRAYFTRHGAGPLPGELAGPPYGKISGETNVTNEFQGDLRYAYLNPQALWKRITADLTTHGAGIKIHPRLAVTCVDQVHGPFRYVVEGREIEADIHGAEIAKFVSNLHPMGGGDLRPLPPIYSDGPGRADVRSSEEMRKAA